MAGLADALGANRARLAIILFVKHHPGTTRAEITKAMGIGHQTVYIHPQALEDQGITVADVPADDRHGKKVRYTLHAQSLRDDITALLRELE